MEAWTGWQMRDRYDRHVRRARLSVNPGAPPHRLSFMTEEALRLSSLPGENEGRVYYFRSLRVTGLPASGARELWLGQFQRALTQQAMQAVHGADPRAGFARSVFFRSEEEALETLLHRILARGVLHEWFWPMVTAESGAREPGPTPLSSTPNDRTIVAIVEKLRSRPASWVAVAAALFASPQFDVAALLDAVPPAVAQGWLRQMEGTRPLPGNSAAADIPKTVRPAIQRSLRTFGFPSARVVWLAALAVLLDSPSELAAGTAVWRARSALRRMVSEGGRGTVQVPVSAGSEASTPTKTGMLQMPVPVPPVVEPVAPEDAPLAAQPASGSRPIIPASALPASTSPDPVSIPTPVPASPADSAPLPAATFDQPAAAPVPPLPWYCSGLPTDAAGMFFLLNAMRRIGMSQALTGELAWAAPDFTARVLQRLAAAAGAAQDDPVLLWLNSLVSNTTTEELIPCDASCWPANLRLSRNAATLDDLVRAWALGVRRWCWRTGKISVRDIVIRAGVFSVNRTDLDVSLPLHKADIRVRKVGLDLDPGWLPWFGRVVRFHYLLRGEFHG
jgi:hypothetical protein